MVEDTGNTRLEYGLFFMVTLISIFLIMIIMSCCQLWSWLCNRDLKSSHEQLMDVIFLKLFKFWITAFNA